MIGRGALSRRRAAGAGQLAKVPPRHVLGDDLRDDSVFTGLASLQHGVQIPLALRPSIPREDLPRHLFLQRFVGRQPTRPRMRTPCASNTPPCSGRASRSIMTHSFGLLRRLRRCCRGRSPAPISNQRASPSQTYQRGVVWGSPSGRMEVSRATNFCCRTRSISSRLMATRGDQVKLIARSSCRRVPCP
jgi:hypothetical protein